MSTFMISTIYQAPHVWFVDQSWSKYCTRIFSIFVSFFLGRGGVRNESRAAKVALMKIKMKATGDSSVPQVCAF